MKRDMIAGIFFTVIAIFFVVAMLAIHPFGKPDNPQMDDYIINNCQEQTGANNGVTSVVFDYRGFDTLGEATILFTAVAGVMLIFRRVLHE
jgi:multisubunit Na+/H+ antiporter MnhB subunit